MQARLMLTDKMFGGLVDDANLQQYYAKKSTGQLKIPWAQLGVIATTSRGSITSFRTAVDAGWQRHSCDALGGKARPRQTSGNKISRKISEYSEPLVGQATCSTGTVTLRRVTSTQRIVPLKKMHRERRRLN